MKVILSPHWTPIVIINCEDLSVSAEWHLKHIVTNMHIDHTFEPSGTVFHAHNYQL